MLLVSRATTLAASAVLAVGTLGLAACGDDDDDGATDTTEAETGNGTEAPDDALSISASDFEFSTESLTADGTEDITVVFTNDDGAPHSFTIDELDVDIDVSGGSSDSATFSAEPGTYEYYCTYHGTMRGTLEVQ